MSFIGITAAQVDVGGLRSNSREFYLGARENRRQEVIR